MLCTIESIKRILETQKDNIKIGTDDDDTLTEISAYQSIREADALIYSYLDGIYQLPLRNRILYPTSGIAATKSLIYQPETPRQLAVIIRGDGDLDSTNTVVINGTDYNGAALTEGLVFTSPGMQVTANYFKTVNEDGIECGSQIQALTSASLTVLSYDILNYLCQRLSCYNIYRDIFANNSPNDLPLAVKEWKEQAEKILEKLHDKKLYLVSQVAPSDLSLIERPVYNKPTKFFEYRGIAGLERLYDSDYQDYDGDHPMSTVGSGGSGMTIETQVIIPPGTWTNGSRPATPYNGQSGFNSESQQFEGWNGTMWVILG